MARQLEFEKRPRSSGRLCKSHCPFPPAVWSTLIACRRRGFALVCVLQPRAQPCAGAPAGSDLVARPSSQGASRQTSRGAALHAATRRLGKGHLGQPGQPGAAVVPRGPCATPAPAAGGPGFPIPPGVSD